MAKRPTLTLAFLTHAPGSAAEVLEQVEVDEAAAFLDEVPARLAAPVLSHMAPWSAARCAGRMSPAQAAAALQNLSFHDNAGLMRHVEGSRREAIFEELPARLARRLRNALRYPAGSVGAWIDPDVPTFADDASVGDALRYVSEGSAASHVFLHARDSGRFAGALPVTALLRSDRSRPLGELPADRVRPLSSRATLASVAFLAEWDRYLVLPVIGRSRAVVGGLSRSSLRRGLHEKGSVQRRPPATLAGHLLAALAVTCTGLFRVLSQTEARHTRG